jgi:hypothetical protein
MHRPRGQLGQVIPALLIVVGLVDIALRFMSIDPLTFRAWEAMTRYRTPGAAFEWNARGTEIAAAAIAERLSCPGDALES